MSLLKKVSPFLKESLSATTALKGLASVDPRIRSFIFAASAAGYGADMVLDFLRGSKSPQDLEADRMRSRQAQGSARPEEEALLSRDSSAEGAQNLLKRGAQLASGLAAASGIPSVPQGTQEDITVEEVETPQGYFERALQGAKVSDIDQTIRPNLLKIKDRLDILEKQKVPYEDSRVQKFVRSLRSMIGSRDIQTQEEQRFAGQYGKGEADARFNDALGQIEQLLARLIGG